eukprot:15504533-Heterocapsa_arctica.AAC.1
MAMLKFTGDGRYGGCASLAFAAWGSGPLASKAGRAMIRCDSSLQGEQVGTPSLQGGADRVVWCAPLPGRRAIG